jgi:hypothetical protein
MKLVTWPGKQVPPPSIDGTLLSAPLAESTPVGDESEAGEPESVPGPPGLMGDAADDAEQPFPATRAHSDAIAEITPTRAAQTIKRLQAARAASNPSNSTHTVTSGAVLRKFRRASLVPTAPTSGGVN